MSRLFGSVRKASLALVALAVVGTSMAPAAFAQDNGRHIGWDRNGKAAQKANKQARKANRKAQKANAQVIVVDPDDRAIDRSRRRTSTRRDDRYYSRNRTTNGARVYDYRNTPYDPYTPYPQYRQNPYNRSNGGYYGGNGGYYGNNGGYYGNNGGYYGNNPYGYNYPAYNDNREGDIDRDEVARRAQQSGYYAGFERGAYDAQRRNRANPQGHGAYQHGFDGYNPEWGSASTYQQYYRSSFVAGYQDGYGRRSYSNRYPRNRWW